MTDADKLPDMAKLARTRYPGIYKRILANGKTVYDVKAVFQGQQKWERGKLKEHEAREAQSTMLKSMQEGTMGKAPARLLLKDYLSDRWLPHKKITKPRSYNTYRSTIKRVIESELGKKRLIAVRADDVQRFISSLFTVSGLAPRSCSLTLAALSDAMTWAVKWQMLAKNPCQWVQAAPAEDRELPDLTPELIATILKAVAGTPIDLPAQVAMAAGMREKEIMELRWSSVDFGAAVIKIMRATTKSKKGERVLLLGPAILERLQAHRHEQMRAFRAQGLPSPEHVFLNARSEPWRATSFRYRWRLVSEADESGFRGLHFHDLRHINSTLMGKAGVQLGVMQKRLGHATIEQTMDYTHFDTRDQVEAAAVVEALLWPPQSSK